MGFLVCPAVFQIDLINRFSSRVIDICLLCGLGDVHTLLVDQVDDESALLVGHRFVRLSHLSRILK